MFPHPLHQQSREKGAYLPFAQKCGLSKDKAADSRSRSCLCFDVLLKRSRVLKGRDTGLNEVGMVPVCRAQNFGNRTVEEVNVVSRNPSLGSLILLRTSARLWIL